MQPWQPRLHRGEAGVEREALEKMELAQPPCRDPPRAQQSSRTPPPPARPGEFGTRASCPRRSQCCWQPDLCCGSARHGLGQSALFLDRLHFLSGKWGARTSFIRSGEH